MHDAMESGAGIYRTSRSLEDTCRVIAELRVRYGRLKLEDRSNVFNTDLLQAIELGCMLDVAEAPPPLSSVASGVARLAPAA